jgi:hypothetical protein
MFRRDAELITEAYRTRISELNLGQGPQDGPSEGLSPEKRVAVLMPKKKVVKDGVVSSVATPQTMNKSVMIQTPAGSSNPAAPAQQQHAADPAEAEEDENCEECGGACGCEDENTDSDAYMAKQLIFRIFKLASMLYPLMRNGTEIEAWVLDKISKAHDNLNSVFGYKDFENFKEKIKMMGGLNVQQEETEIDLYNAINKGGDDLILNLKHVLNRESRETKEKLFLEVIKQLEG